MALTVGQLLEALTERRRILVRQIETIDSTIDALRDVAVPVEVEPPASDKPPETFCTDVAPDPEAPTRPSGRKVRGKRRAYSPAEKAAAAELADSVGIAEASRRLGVHETMIRRWRQSGVKPNTPPTGNSWTGPGLPEELKPPGAPKAATKQVERSPVAGKGTFVPSGLKTAVDEAAGRRAAFADPDAEILAR